MNKQINVMLLMMVGFEEEEARNLYTVLTESVECRHGFYTHITYRRN